MKRLFSLFLLLLIVPLTSSADTLHDLQIKISAADTLQEAYEILAPILGQPDIIAATPYVDEWTMEPYPSELVAHTYVTWIMDKCFYELDAQTWIEIRREGNSFTGYEYTTRYPLNQSLDLEVFPLSDLEVHMKYYK